MQRLSDFFPSSRARWFSIQDPTEQTNQFEFWPSQVIFLPMALMMLIRSIGARSFTFFQSTNPAMENGGLFGYSKSSILDAFPQQNRPKSFLIEFEGNIELVLNQVRGSGISFPLYVKPNQGERGRGVRCMHAVEEMATYFLSVAHGAYLLQEEVRKGLEFGVFCIKEPNSLKFKISSLTLKVSLQVMGDGFSTIGDLVRIHPRASRYVGEIEGLDLGLVPDRGEIVKLSRIGNHSRGAAFLDCNDSINPDLEGVFESICAKVDGFYYGRLDVIVPAWEDLWKPEAIRILEVNGCNSEPIHIYSPGYTYWEALRVIWVHVSLMFRIAIQNSRNDFRSYNWRICINNFLNYRKSISGNVG